MGEIKELRPDQKVELKIDDEFKNLIPAITPEEKAELEKSLIAGGCREPLVVWNGIILDGHTRHAICRQHGIEYKITSEEFKDRDQAKIWIISNQLARRNLKPDQMKCLRGERYNLEKKESVGFKDRDLSGGKNCPRESTAEKLGREYGVSPRTIRSDAKFAEAVDKLPPEEKQYILSGKSKKTKKEIMGKSKLAFPEESTFVEDIKNTPEPTESEKLWNLKRWWKLASKKDKKIFIIGVYAEIKDWIRKEEKGAETSE